ncbi:extracellular calcium-sensing receptor-like [Microcaecilia unicolor]|uniref:Extracellular calcium-sensing receptor-like n=1 Tax=Microcaecilia unicolor TaxID=1415580 RepID=A0A6P7YTQ7_9AMPH|nr:extracellular calcium-sensing receptor-like [Microcaecilia unicolor]
MHLAVILVFLSLSGTAGESVQRGWTLTSWDRESFFHQGDAILGGIFLLHSKMVYSTQIFTKAPQPASCERFQVRFFRDMLALVFALCEINHQSELLPNFTLGFRIYDSCYTERRALEDVLRLLSGGRQTLVPNYNCQAQPDLVGIVGDALTSTSEVIARILGNYRIPQISHGAQHGMFNDKISFPSFFRTVPGNTVQPYALVQLLHHFGWTWLGILASDNDLCDWSSQVLKLELERSGSCVAFLEKIHDSYSWEKIEKIVEVILKSTANVIVCDGYNVHFKPVLESLLRHHLHGKVWIFSPKFGMVESLFSKEAWKLLSGSLALIIHTGEMPGFKEFLYNIHPATYPDSVFVKLFWEEVFRCRWPEAHFQSYGDGKRMEKLQFCTGEEKLHELDPSIFEFDDFSYAYHAYLGVYAFAHALQDLTAGRLRKGLLSSGTSDTIYNIHPWQVLDYLKKVHFITRFKEEIMFDVKGEVPAVFDILNLQILPDDTSKLLKVGQFESRPSHREEIRINVSAIQWTKEYAQIPRSVCSDSCPPGFRISLQQGQPNCCFDCVPCPTGEIANETDAAQCWECPEDQWPNPERTKCLPKIVEFLSYQDPVSIALVSLAVLLFFITLYILCIFIQQRETPIVKANNRTLSYLLLAALMLCFLCALMFIGHPLREICLIRQSAFGVIFTISVSAVLAKTITVIIAFNATKPNSQLRRYVGPRTPIVLVVSCSFLQILLCIAWLLVTPPFLKVDAQSVNGKIIIECNEGFDGFYYCMLGYLGILSLVSLVVAFLGRKLPDRFNEAKYITFSMVVFLSVWLSFIPAYLSTQGKSMVAVEIFAILSSSAGLLGCIFLPKCYIILLRSDKNTKKHINVKSHPSRQC